MDNKSHVKVIACYGGEERTLYLACNYWLLPLKQLLASLFPPPCASSTAVVSVPSSDTSSGSDSCSATASTSSSSASLPEPSGTAVACATKSPGVDKRDPVLPTLSAELPGGELCTIDNSAALRKVLKLAVWATRPLYIRVAFPTPTCAVSRGVDSAADATSGIIQVPARVLNCMECVSLGFGGSVPSATLPTVVVIGGVHGNEVMGIEGVQRLKSFLTTKPAHPFALRLLATARIVVVPCINPIGYLARARCCPVASENCSVNYNTNTGEIVVQDTQRGSISPPPGWKDPNRGWAANDTLVKHNLKSLLDSVNPSVLIFNHDWAAPQAKLVFYGESPIDVKGISRLLSKFYPCCTPFGKPWQFVEPGQMAEEPEEVTLSWYLRAELGISSYVCETYMKMAHSAAVHFAVCLFLISKYARLDMPEPDLIKAISAICFAKT
ncbi:hypothetical protein Pelo_7686 [Pelomyxa schiedti]|nr:hypothetical protein Pelo_7686 [Pelomyxa schiedti]